MRDRRAGACISRTRRTQPRTEPACCWCRANLLASTRQERIWSFLHTVTPKPPSAVEGELPGGPGYFFNRKKLRALSDASGGRVRRFCAESSVRLNDGSRLTSTNAIQAGEMHYNEGGASPYHLHKGTDANPDGARSRLHDVQGSRQRRRRRRRRRKSSPALSSYFPPGVPHRLNAHGGPLDYFEIQAWRSFKTDGLEQGSRVGAQVVLRADREVRAARGVEPELGRHRAAVHRCDFGRRARERHDEHQDQIDHHEQASGLVASRASARSR